MFEPSGRAWELGRGLGEKANESGTTFAMPPLKILGSFKLGSKLVTVTGDRSRPRAVGTIGWDEEGVKPEDFTLVREGIVTDYVTTRGTAPTISSWYANQGRRVRSHGCAGRTGGLQPILQLPNLSLKPGPDSTSLDDLIKSVKKGFDVPQGFAAAGQQQINVQVYDQNAREI